jgi:two-component system CheB/CheR fusion protein
MKLLNTKEQLLNEVQELRLQLEEANDTIHAIRSGQIDALIVQGENGHQLYTLKTADHAYRVFIEKMQEGALTLNPQGIIIYSNSSFASFVDIPLEKVVGLPFDSFIPTENKAEFNALVEDGWIKDHKLEIYLQNKDGQLIPFLLSSSALELEEGLSISIILTDLSSQKETQRQLKLKNEQLEEAKKITERLNDQLEELVKERTKELYLSQEHFKFLADNIPVIVWTTLPDGRVNYFNKQWYNYTGFTFEQSKDFGWKDALHPEDIQSTVKTWGRAIKSEKPYETEYRFKSGSDGQYRWYLSNALPFKDEKGKVVAWFGTSTDIEDQKLALQKKDEFIGVASHELKTPLTSVKGYLQLIESYKKEELPAGVRQYVQKANDCINKLQFLVNALLDVSKIQAGKLEFNTVQMHLKDLLDTCIENTHIIYPDFNISQQNEEDFIINGNFGQLEQVLMNLINNAVKYSPVNKEISVKAERVRDCVRVSVQDWGIGLSEDHKKRIFERFYRVEDRKFLTSGLGMGLYISLEIIKAHQGIMGVESKLHQGSVFYFDLPLQLQ